MAVRITHIRMANGGSGHEHITHYYWIDESTGQGNSIDKPSMVQWLGEAGHNAYVGTGASRAEVGVVRPQYGEPYLRTHADGQWNNNLLSLPRF